MKAKKSGKKIESGVGNPEHPSFSSKTSEEPRNEFTPASQNRRTAPPSLPQRTPPTSRSNLTWEIVEVPPNLQGDFLGNAAEASAWVDALEKLTGVRLNNPAECLQRSQQHGPNVPTPEWVPILKAAIDRLGNDPVLAERLLTEPGLKAFHTQTLNHLRHVSFEFSCESADYPHEKVLEGPAPFRPTVKALQKALEFQRFLTATEVFDPQKEPPDVEAETRFNNQEKATVSKMIADPFGTYSELRQRLEKEGDSAHFPEFAATVGYLELKLRTDPDVQKVCSQAAYMNEFRAVSLSRIREVADKKLPYLATLDAIERAVEFFDIVQRTVNPKESPELYHSGRYEYYLHYLTAQGPEHITFPTIAALGSTDLIKVRGVPLGFVGVNTSNSRVDGFIQTPYEFFIHDVNHVRRMFQFALKEAQRQGGTRLEFYRNVSAFVQDTLLPLITPAPGDDEATKKQKRIKKMILFEVLHEDALAASRDIIAQAIQRAAGTQTPFERIEGGNKVVYFNEPGATTLAYVFRKLAHTFYDVPQDRKAFIVTEDLRTREAIVDASRALLTSLQVEVSDTLLRHQISTDEGLPEAFRRELSEDIYRVAGAFLKLLAGEGSEEEKISIAQKLGELVLMAGPHLVAEERQKLLQLAPAAEIPSDSEAQKILRHLMRQLETQGVSEASGLRFQGTLDERLKSIGLTATNGAKMKNVEVRLFVNDVSLLPVEALVVPQFSNEVSVGGLGGAILRAGGKAGLDAFGAFLEANGGSIEYGRAHLTQSGCQRWPYLIHVASVRSGKESEYENAFKSTVNALTLASKAGLQSLAMVALGTGPDGRLTNEQSARAILGAIEYVSMMDMKAPDVAIAFNDPEIYAAFANILNQGEYHLTNGQLKPEPGMREFNLTRWAHGMRYHMNNQDDYALDRAASA